MHTTSAQTFGVDSRLVEELNAATTLGPEDLLELAEELGSKHGMTTDEAWSILTQSH